jgi:magnesium-transporting ATPase (P-type)
MGESIRHSEVVERWQQKMPRFFRQLTVVCACIATVAFTVNTAMNQAGATPHEWWTDVYPYLIGVPVGVIMASKLTVAGGYKTIVDPDGLLHGFDQEQNMED